MPDTNYAKKNRSWMEILARLAGTAGLACMLLAGAATAYAQDDAEQKGIEEGNYTIKQSVEFGFRFADISGDPQTYDTFVNLQQGARLLDFTTEMTSNNHAGLFFDRLFFSNFGYGGDPNNVSRLRISKDKWYNFDALFRRDVNAFNYSLLANPLNPVTPPVANASTGFTPLIGFSPHLFDTVRRMGDYNLTLLPQSRVRFRVGYSHNVDEGPSFTSTHQGTEPLLFQNYKTTLDAFRIGVDFKVLPRTNISYDQILSYYKGDTGFADENQNFILPNGTPVDIGISINPVASQPCGSPFLPGGAVNPTCNAFLSDTQNGRVRTSLPTEQLSLQSGYFKNIDLSGRFSYTGGDMKLNDYNWMLAGRESRTNLSNANLFGPIEGRRVAAAADFGVTWHINDQLSILDSFHFANFHDPASFNASACSFFSTDMLTPSAVFSPTSPVPVVCDPPAGAVAGTPTHASSSEPDISLALLSLFLKQDEKTNLFEVDYQFSRRLGVRAGYRYRHRSINDSDFEQKQEIFFPSNANRGDCALTSAMTLPDGCVANGDGSFTFTTPGPIAPDTGQVLINENSGLFGIWARPVDNWRISFDAELMSADNAFTRISPRQTQQYRLRTSYKPVNWFSLSGSMTIWEGRNNVVQINNLQHNRSFGFSASIDPSPKYAFELGYDYNNVYSQILICYVSSTAPTGLAQCPGSTVLVQQLSTYTDLSHFAFADFTVRPIKFITLRAGTNVTVTNGSAIVISPNQPPGTLNSRYYQPFAGVDLNFTKNWTGKAYWGYYNYGEERDPLVTQDLLAPRDFTAHLETISLRYAF